MESENPLDNLWRSCWVCCRHCFVHVWHRSPSKIICRLANVLKVIGGAYLIWLGIKLWRSPPISLSADMARAEARGLTLFRSGFFTAATNPKGLLFFSALLPQFIDPHRSLAIQLLMIGATYAFVEFAVEYLYAATAHRIRPWLARVGRRFNQVCGGIFVAVGAALPLR